MRLKAVGFALSVVGGALAGTAGGYLGGFYLGAWAADRSFPPGGNAGDGLGAVLIGWLVMGLTTLFGLLVGASAPFLVRRLRRVPPSGGPATVTEPPAA